MPWDIKKEKKIVSEDLGIFIKTYPPKTYTEASKAEVKIIPKISKEVGEEHPYNFELYENAYRTVPIIHGAINKTVDFVLGPGFYIECKNKTVKNKIEKFMEDQDFDTFLRIVTRNMLIYGSAFVEKVGSKKKFNLNVLDPKNIFIKRDKHGKVIGYTQYLNSGKKIPFKPEKIAHFAYNQTGDNIYGTSMLRPLFGSKRVRILQQFLEVQEAMKSIIKRRANSPIHFKVGTDEFPATASDIEAIADELVDLGDKNELVTSHTVSADVIGFKGRQIDIRPFIEHYESNIIYNLEVPAVLLGRANVPEGLANVQMAAFERRATSLQSFIEKTIEKKIFKQIAPKTIIEFQWGEPTTETEDVVLKRLMNLLKTPDLSSDTKRQIDMLIRKRLGIEGDIPKEETTSIPPVSEPKGED